MLAFTHIAAGCASSLLVSGALNAQLSQTILVLGGGILGSMMPDIDYPQSAFGKRVLPLSIPIAAVFGHRGITNKKKNLFLHMLARVGTCVSKY
jgi:inner membrane protein